MPRSDCKCCGQPATQLADRVVIVSEGWLAGQGTPAELAADDGAVLVRTPQAGQLIRALAVAGGRAERTGPDSLRVTGMAAAGISRIARAQDIDLHELAAGHGSLEQAFLRLTATPGEEQQPPRQAGERS